MDRRSRMGRTCFLTYSEEVLALRLGPVFSKIFETYVCPYDLLVSSATGYWSHVHQDVQKFTGHYKPMRPYFDFGSWDLTVSYAAALAGVVVVDHRSSARRYHDFEVTSKKLATGCLLPVYEVPKLVAK